MTTRVCLVRHAESAMNRDHRDLVGGRSNQTPLSDDGEAAARRWGQARARLPRPDAIAHTSALRSIRTAQLIAQGAEWSAPFVLEDGLLELSQGVAEGQPREQWWTPAALAAMRADPLGHVLSPGGESHRQVQERMRQALGRLADRYPGGYVVAVGHGIAIRSLAWSITGGSHDVFRQTALPNLGALEVIADPQGRVRVAAGSAGPVPIGAQTT